MSDRSLSRRLPDFAAIAREFLKNRAYTFDFSSSWFYCRPASGEGPVQGWKLHISAYDGTAEVTLKRALPVLAEAEATFKFAVNLEMLGRLNVGDGGESQRGKFVTVYPNSAIEAVALAAALHQTTSGLEGPAVPSDRQFRPGSSVFYRYGSFATPYTVSPIGRLTTSLIDPNGSYVPDMRGFSYWQPPWLESDPFDGVEPAADVRLIGGRYVPVVELHRSIRGAVWAAADLEARSRVIVKFAGSSPNEGRIEREAAYLKELGHPIVPRVLEQFYDPDHSKEYLILADDGGDTLEQVVRRDGPFDSARLQGVAVALARVLVRLGEAQVVHRDLKPSNLLLLPDDSIQLIDFDIAAKIGSPPKLLHGRGTPGFASPQQWDWQQAHPADDVYSAGAILFYAATGFELREKEPERLGLCAVDGQHSETFSGLVLDCLNPARERRPTATELEVRLSSARMAFSKPAVPDLPAGDPEEFARAVASAILEAARDGSARVTIWDHGPGTESEPRRDLASGDAGPLFVLARLASYFELDIQDSLADLARRARAPKRIVGRMHPGLYVGEAGWFLAQALCAKVLGDRTLFEETVETSLCLAAEPHFSPDLYHGSAGRARFHLAMWEANGNPGHLEAALAAGHYLLETQTAEDGRSFWRMPENLEGFGGTVMFGYAHGAAGIGDVLADLWQASKDARFAEAALGACRFLVDSAIISEGSTAAADWPTSPGDADRPRLWCRGATGIGRFLLRIRPLLEELNLARRVDTLIGLVIQGVVSARWLNPTLCHGHAGSLEFLLDAGARPELAAATASLIEAFAIPGKRPGYFGDNHHFTWNYMTGSGGTALTVARYHAHGFAGGHLCSAALNPRVNRLETAL